MIIHHNGKFINLFAVVYFDTKQINNDVNPYIDLHYNNDSYYRIKGDDENFDKVSDFIEKNKL